MVADARQATGQGSRPPHRRFWLEIAAVVIFVLISAAIATRWHGIRGRAREDSLAFDVSRLAAVVSAPPFELLDLDGRPVRLHDFRGRIVLLNFWATWCPPCRDEMPALADLPRAFGDEGLTVLAINEREPAETARAFLTELGLHLTVLLDRDGAVGERYGVLGIPTTMAVDRSGRIVGRMVGYREWASPSARSYLAGLLREPVSGGTRPSTAGTPLTGGDGMRDLTVLDAATPSGAGWALFGRRSSRAMLLRHQPR